MRTTPERLVEICEKYGVYDAYVVGECPLNAMAARVHLPSYGQLHRTGWNSAWEWLPFPRTSYCSGSLNTLGHILFHANYPELKESKQSKDNAECKQ